MKRFEIKDYNFGELAQMYYPDREYLTAVRRFSRRVAADNWAQQCSTERELQGQRTGAHP